MSFSNDSLARILAKHPQVPGASIALISRGQVHPHCTGLARVHNREECTSDHYLQCASLSKTVAAAFAVEYFRGRNITMDMSANKLLRAAGSTWFIKSTNEEYNADVVTLAMLVNHTALGMHYVYGIPLTERTPCPAELLDGRAERYKYHALYLERSPGRSFSYSGGGFVVLQHLIETVEGGRAVALLARDFLDHCGLAQFTFTQLDSPLHAKYAYGHIDANTEVAPLAFPPFAAGGLCTPKALASFLVHLYIAYHCPVGSGSISQYTARLMLAEENLLDLGALDFMGAKIGLGVFVATAGPNKIMLHQAANDGFRGVYMLCFEGPDAGSGFVVLSNGDNPAVLFQGELCRELLGPAVLNMQGIDFSKYKAEDLQFDMSNLKQEVIVNKGLKDLVISAFLPAPTLSKL